MSIRQHEDNSHKFFFLLSTVHRSLLTAMRRPEKFAEAVREEVIQIVGFELDDPRVAGVTVTDVRMSDDLRDASVYVTVEGAEAEAKEALETLRRAATYVRKQLSLALDFRHAPIVHFVRDRVEERAARVDHLLHEIAPTLPSSDTDVRDNAVTDTRDEAARSLDADGNLSDTDDEGDLDTSARQTVDKDVN